MAPAPLHGEVLNTEAWFSCLVVLPMENSQQMLRTSALEEYSCPQMDTSAQFLSPSGD
jgi:hypothetical protein